MASGSALYHVCDVAEPPHRAVVLAASVAAFGLAAASTDSMHAKGLPNRPNVGFRPTEMALQRRVDARAIPRPAVRRSIITVLEVVEYFILESAPWGAPPSFYTCRSPRATPRTKPPLLHYHDESASLIIIIIL